MIFNFTDTTRFYFYGDSVDMRKGIHSLYHLIKTSGTTKALNGDAYIFIGKSRKSVKILRWQKAGFVLYQKKLELGRYTLPHTLGNELLFELKNDAVDNMVNAIKLRSFARK